MLRLVAGEGRSVPDTVATMEHPDGAIVALGDACHLGHAHNTYTGSSERLNMESSEAAVGPYTWPM